MNDHIAALIPAHNDAYSLRFALPALADVADEIVVLDDHSSDGSGELAGDLFPALPVHVVDNKAPQLGWIEARNRLMAETDARHLLWLDADDILADDAGPILRAYAAGPDAMVRLGLCELWGDWDHTTQRLFHHDPCHVYVDRELAPEQAWAGGTAARPTGARARNGQELVAFHAKGVKASWRLVERQFVRPWLRADRPTPLAVEYAGLAEMPAAEVERRAMQMLLHSRQDHIQRTWGATGTALVAGAPERPAVVVEDDPPRFLMTYDDEGDLTGRADRAGQLAGYRVASGMECRACGHRYACVYPLWGHAACVAGLDECPSCGACRGIVRETHYDPEEDAPDA